VAKLSRKKIEAYYTALGRFVTVWAEVEQYLDLLVIILAKPDVPHQLSEKIAIIRRKLPSASAILLLISDIGALADTRHDYVHGSMIGHTVTRSNLRREAQECLIVYYDLHKDASAEERGQSPH
jgi:hypothetical protein